MSSDVRMLESWGTPELRERLPVPAADAHKYSRGVLMLIAGSPSYPGAACLAARAAQRMGTGYV